jgi:hypothetical protein
MALVLDESIDETNAVPDPIPIGGVSIHHSRVLHWSGPNKTANQRRAYVNDWARQPVKRDTPYERPWYWGWEEAKAKHFAKGRSAGNHGAQ